MRSGRYRPSCAPDNELQGRRMRMIPTESAHRIAVRPPNGASGCLFPRTRYAGVGTPREGWHRRHPPSAGFRAVSARDPAMRSWCPSTAGHARLVERSGSSSCAPSLFRKIAEQGAELGGASSDGESANPRTFMSARRHHRRASSNKSVLRPVRNSPPARVLDRSARRLRGTKPLQGW